jgi:two-component system, chemotaxis family, CheB/CheR fusion protein
MAVDETASKTGFSIVAIGASAGGLAALKTFFAHVEPETGAAFVIVVHLAPDRESFLPELLQPSARLPVQSVTETVPLEPNRVYIIPPGSYLAAVDTHLRLAELAEKRYERGPIDHFFRTLAATHDGEAVGIILTGTGSDGALGMKAIKEHGGVTIAQDPEDAEYDGMPRSAIATGMVDLVLPVAQIPSQLKNLKQLTPTALISSDHLDAAGRGALQGIFAQVKARTRHDFSRYKPSTILRRIHRRMQLRQLETLDAYLQVLRNVPEETLALANEFLINVTSFFRDTEVFAALETHVIPQLFAGRTPNDAIRAWSVGCATGEEAYSLAMLLVEAARRESAPPRVQVFASDLHEPSLKVAREGLYNGHLEADLGAERLARFFVEETHGYRIRADLRDCIVFAQHDLLADPPFSRLDLIVCRNLLIYLQRDAQRDVIELFHYALNSGGVLVLGNAETLDEPELFHLENRAQGIYRKRNAPAREARLPAFATGGGHFDDRLGRHTVLQAGSYGALHQKMVERYALPSILVGPGEKTVHVSQRAGRFLQIPGGELTANVFNLVRPELSIELHAAVATASSKRTPVRARPVTLTLDGSVRQVVMHVSPAADDNDEQGYSLIVFDECDPSVSTLTSAVADGTGAEELRSELALMRQRFQAVTEEYTSAREQMRSSNEELQSTNEELRSTMEELETSKEELQSINEELTTLNQENRHKVDELSQMTSDLQNLIVATDIPTLFVDRELRIMRFTPRLADVFNVRSTDRGRPLSDLTHRLGALDLIAIARRVLDDLITVEQEVQDTAGRWHLLRLRPYRAAEDRIGGVVLTLIDITPQKRALAEIQEAKEHAERVINTIAEPLVILTPDLKVRSANRSFYEHFQVAPPDTIGRLVYDLGNRQWDIPMLRTLLEEVLPEKSVVDDFEVAHRFEQLGERTILVNARQLNASDLILVGFRDVTDLKRVEQSLREADRRKDEFLAMLAHELRNPLAAIVAALAVQRKGTSPIRQGHTQDILERQTAYLVRLVDDLLDISRITGGKVELRRQRTELNALVRDAVESISVPSNCVVNSSIPAETIVAYVDPVRIAQVIANLINNGCRYSPDGGRIVVALIRMKEEAVISVRDEGIGIKPELLSRVFDMFVQLDSSVADRQSSLGVGLTLVRSLVELHGGRAEAKSDGPGTGSEFSVYLPLADEGASRETSSDSGTTTDDSELQPIRALVVDDNRDAADMMAALLRSGGHKVHVAYGGVRALDALATSELDLAFIDLAMPDMDGYELARRVRRNPQWNHVCLVALTGFGQPQARERSTTAGFDYHLVKPIAHADLQEVIVRCDRRQDRVETSLLPQTGKTQSDQSLPSD